jgi:hypothetical protein
MFTAGCEVNSARLPACENYGTPHETGTIQNPKLPELSGLAVSRRNPGVMWGHNDSGDGPYLFAMTLDGKNLGSAILEGAENFDWEDLSFGLYDGAWCLWVADIGDNTHRRPYKSIYIVAEPPVDPRIAFGEMRLEIIKQIQFEYPDGRHDAEAFAVHPDGRAYVVTKLPDGTAGLYVFPEELNAEIVTVRRVGSLNLMIGDLHEIATAADIHPGGRRLLLRTYNNAFEWRLTDEAPFEDIVNAPRREVPVGMEFQGESIAYDPASGGYIHASERVAGHIPTVYHISCADDPRHPRQ